MRTLPLALTLLLAAGSAARADDGDFAPIGALPYAGGGVTTTGRFDGKLGYDITEHAGGRLWGGGFFELHTVGFDTLDGSVGAQAQLRITDTLGLQARIGVGGNSDGAFSIAGLAVGNILGDISVTARRPIDYTGPTTFAVNVDLSALLVAVPFMDWPWIGGSN